MKNKIYCLYPKEETTDFLNKIPDSLTEHLGDSFCLIRIEPDDTSHNKAIEAIKESPDGSIFIFLGHGNSYTLQGAEFNGYKKEIFIDSEKLSLFNNKSLFALACRSVELIDVSKYITNFENFHCITFPNIISSNEELNKEREVKNKKLYPNLTKEEINNSNSILVSSVIYALKGLKESNSLKIIYNRFIHSINQEMVNVLIEEPNLAKRDLVDMIFKMKTEVMYEKI